MNEFIFFFNQFRISGSIREVPKLRTCDITLILSAILNTLNFSPGKPSTGWQGSVGINRVIYKFFNHSK